MIPAEILAFIKAVSALIGAGKSAYEFYETVFGNQHSTSLQTMVTQLEANFGQIIHVALEQGAIDDAKAAAQTSIDFLSVDLANEIANNPSAADVYAYLNGDVATSALTSADNQAAIMEAWSLDANLTDTETMQAIQTLPLYLLLGHICLAIYQAQARFATEASDQTTALEDMGSYASRFQSRAGTILNTLIAGRRTYITSQNNIEEQTTNPKTGTQDSSGTLAMKDTWIPGDSMLKYDWHDEIRAGVDHGNVATVTAQINTLIGLHTAFLGSPDLPSYEAILQAASKSDQLPQATHFEDYFSKHPVYPPVDGYVAEAYQFGMFIRYLQDSIAALGQIAANPSQPSSAMQPPEAPAYNPSSFDAAFQNGQPGPGSWTPGYSVQYAVSFYLGSDPANADYETATGAWSETISSQTSYYPQVTQIQVDPTGLATGRKIYRQFQGHASEYVGYIADNIATTYQDTNDAIASAPVGGASAYAPRSF